MTELLRVALRVIAVVLPGAALLGLVELLGGAPDGDFGTFIGAMLLSLLAAAVWAAIDATRVSTVRALVRWVAVAFIVGGGLGLGTTLMAPGSPPSERTSEVIWTSAFYVVPLLVAVGFGWLLGVAVTAENNRARRKDEDTGDTPPGD